MRGKAKLYLIFWQALYLESRLLLLGFRNSFRCGVVRFCMLLVRHVSADTKPDQKAGKSKSDDPFS